MSYTKPSIRAIRVNALRRAASENPTGFEWTRDQVNDLLWLLARMEKRIKWWKKVGSKRRNPWSKRAAEVAAELRKA